MDLTWSSPVCNGEGERANVVRHHSVGHVLVVRVLGTQLASVSGSASGLEARGWGRRLI